MSFELIVLADEGGVESEYTRMDVANITARQRVLNTGEPVTLKVYEVSGSSRILKRRLRMLKRLDGSVGVARA